jgi:hypothetical protein
MSDLSDADRARIEAEERFRHETRSKLEKKTNAWIWWLIGTPLALLVGAWFLGSILIETGAVPRTEARDIGTEMAAYRKAADDFARKKTTIYYTPNIATYSPGAVTRTTAGQYMVTLTYQGIGFSGTPEPQTVLYSIRCTPGLCMVIGGPK